MIGPLSKRFGEHRLFQVGVLGFSLAMVFTVLAGELGSYYGAMFGLAFQSAAAALVLPSMQSLVSHSAAPTERGMVLGIYSSAGTLGRVVGTLVTGVIFAHVHIESPFVIAVGLMLVLFFIARGIEKQWVVQKSG
ncbi:MAG: MFS transporter [Halioglobus sp.]